MSQWIWKFGEYEIYHNLLCHSRRQHYGYTRPPMWKLYTPDPVVRFRKTAVTGGGSVRVKACGDLFVTLQTGENPVETLELNGKREFQIPPGPVVLTLLLNNFRTFPCVYVDGAIESDETWLADDNTSDWNPVGTDPAFQDPEQTPEKFPFSYMPISYVKKEVLENGVLFDFGKETYAETWICGISGDKERISVRFGESGEEALDPVWAVIQFHDRPEAGELRYSPCAFRYVFVEDAEAEVRARYEYLPLERRGSFTDEKEILNRIWETAAYTFHLNCREFILDGIKRDGWVWAADAYQKEHYGMYGHPFEKSLCHAWSASPIYLLGRYVLGVRNTGIAYDSFEVEPYLDGKDKFSGSVPVPGGTVHVSVDAGKIEVFSSVPGGVLVIGERRIPIEAGKKLYVTGFSGNSQNYSA